MKKTFLIIVALIVSSILNAQTHAKKGDYSIAS